MRSGRSRGKYCSVPRCGRPAYCYCQTDSTLLCRSHVGTHRDKGHDIFLHECDLCGGHGRVHGQYASRDPGGRWVRCPKCFGIGFLSGPVRRHGGEDKAGEKRENAPREREAASEVQSKQRDKETVREAEDAVEKARVAREVARKAGAERRAREAARKAERERRARESASKGGDRRPAQETQGRKTDAGRGQHRGCKQIGRCLILACLVLLIAGGAVGVYLALPYFVDEGEEAVPSPTSTPAPPTALPPTPTPSPTATPVPFPLPPDVQSPATDREALVRLYEATDGPNWTDNRNWLSDAPLREWYGVDTDSDGRVTLLYLIDNNLNGVVPINLLSMGRLASLLLEGNPLSGCISEELQATVYDDDLHMLGLPMCSVVPTPVPSPTPIPTPTPVPTATPIPTPTPMPTPTPIPTPKPTSTPVPTPTPRPTATPTPSPKLIGGQLLDPLEIETWVVHYTNVERQNAGLTPFILDPAISNIARMHSENMARLGIYDHTIAGKGPTDRALENGYDCRAYYPDGSYSYGFSENIYQYHRVTQWIGSSGFFGLSTSYRPDIFDEDSKATAYGLVEGWMDSPGHRQNILDRDSRRIGVGVAIQLNEQYGYVDEVVFATQNFSGCK